MRGWVEGKGEQGTGGNKGQIEALANGPMAAWLVMVAAWLVMVLIVVVIQVVVARLVEPSKPALNAPCRWSHQRRPHHASPIWNLNCTHM